VVQQSSEVRFAQVLEQLLKERYRRNRAALAEAADLSPSALSQYVRGRATPSLEVLVRLADAFGVSLDYLVFGQDHVTRAPEYEYGYLTSQVEAGIRKSQADAATLYDLVARIGARLSQQIKIAAQELQPEAVSGTGMLTVDEVTTLESCSTHTVVVTPTLETEVLLLPARGEGETAAPGTFNEVIVENIEVQRSYEYFVPRGDEFVRRAGLLRQEVIDKSGLSADVVDGLLTVRHVPRACAPGYVLYSLVVAELQRRDEATYDRVQHFVIPSTDPGLGHVATVEPASGSYQNFGLLDANVLPRLISELDDLRRSSSAPRADFGAQPVEST
jgi:transcriptional regulator with XRE-family HTH domain